MKNNQTSRIESMFGFINIFLNETTLKKIGLSIFLSICHR